MNAIGYGELVTLKTGDRVWITDKEESGTVVRQTSPRSYLVATPLGTLRRNRRQLASEAVKKEEDEVDTVFR